MMIYNNFLLKLKTAIENKFSEMQSTYNFELGEEFESAICDILSMLLPEKFGVCRGFIVPKTGNPVGDDIIIYDRQRFPLLRFLSKDDPSKKQYVPLEAVYCYIEAKHTMHFSGNIKDGQSLQKALNQIIDVKKLPRDPRMPEQIHPYFSSNVSMGERKDWPKNLNPIFGMIFARYVKNKKGDSDVIKSDEVSPLLVGYNFGNIRYAPDLVVAGDSNIIAPSITVNGNHEFHSPFSIKDVTDELRIFQSEKLAFAISICILLYALDTMALGIMPWPEIIYDGLTNA
jgi:hypothetical protein